MDCTTVPGALQGGNRGQGNDSMTILVKGSESGRKAAPPAAGQGERPDAGPEPPAGHVRTRWLGSVTVVAVGAALMGAVTLLPAPGRNVTAARQAPVVNVKVTQIRPGPQADEIRLPAVLEPYRTVRVSAEVDGRVERLGPEEGTDVEPNQPLVWLNTDLLQAAYDQAKAKHELDTNELRRYQGLDKRGVATDIEMYRAKAAVAVSKAVLTEARERLERAVIRAPMAGVLNDLLVEPGEYVGGGAPVAEVVEIDRLKAVVHLPERDVVHVRVGQEARVLVEAIEGGELAGKVTYIDACGDEMCRTFRTEITADNRGRRARAGLIARVVLLRQTVEDAIMIPLVSVIPTEKGYQVYVLSDGKASRRDVEIGLIVGDRVQVVRGLKGGEKLIVDGHRMVGDGSPVRVVE